MQEKDLKEKIQRLQLMEQSAQSLAAQRQQFQAQITEFDSALAELEKAEKAYKIIGNIMVSGDKKKLSEDLKSRLEIMDIRVKAIEKQEKDLKDKAAKLQQEVLKEVSQQSPKNK